jgi:glucose-6-phosphate isomerase
LIPADFIGFVKPLHGDNEQHDKLMSNLPKQKPYFTENQQKVQIEFDLQGLELAKKLLPFKVFQGISQQTQF